MTNSDLLQIAAYFLVLLAAARPLGDFMARVLAGERHWLSPVLGSWSAFSTAPLESIRPNR